MFNNLKLLKSHIMKNQKTVDFNSNKNQGIKEKFVNLHVHSNVGTMVNYILSQNFDDIVTPFSYDDMDNYYMIRDDEKCVYITQEEKEERLKELEYNDETETDYYKNLKVAELEGMEVFEWYIVSPFLLRKLEKKGEVIISDENIWGRCTTGEHILFDTVISEICNEMGILEGQENEWSI
jgi:hypothetical protein